MQTPGTHVNVPRQSSGCISGEGKKLITGVGPEGQQGLVDEDMLGRDEHVLLGCCGWKEEAAVSGTGIKFSVLCKHQENALAIW